MNKNINKNIINKNDKNKLTIIISAIAFLILIIGSSFAYFGSFNQNISKSKVNVTIDVGASATFVTSGVDLNIDIPATKMVQNDTTSKAIEKETNLNVTLTSGNKNVKTTCTFDIYYEYSSSSKIYGSQTEYVTDSSLKELTLTMTGTGTSDYSIEKNFNIDSNWINNKKRKVMENAQISDASLEGTTKSWNINMAFYNLAKDQNQLAGKSFSGTFYVDKDSINCTFEENKVTLYQTIEQRYNEDKTYLGLYTGEDSETYQNKVYYFKDDVQNNNVLFANFCWKIVRTTDTGGVKLIYNGVQKEEFQSTPVEQSGYTNITNDVNFPYTFDSENKTWASTNHRDYSVGTFSFSLSESGDYILNYTVSSNSYDKASFYKNGTSILSNVSGEKSGTINLTGLTTSDVIEVQYNRSDMGSDGSDNVVFSIGKKGEESVKSCNNTGTDSQIGTSAYNSSDNSPAYVGYMYNNVYVPSSKKILKSMSFIGTYAYGDGVTYANSKYTLKNATTLSVTSSNISTLVGKYTCNRPRTTDTCPNAWYIVGYSGTDIYYYVLSDGTTDGKTLANKNYVFGTSFTYTNGSYTLTSITTINTDNWLNQYSNINTHHYTCFSSNSTCSSLYYMYSMDSVNKIPYYITLKDGKSVEDALNEMLYNDDVNTKDSTIKAYIDNWYKNNMISYTEKLEDTVFCNDRSIKNLSESGWNPNGGNTSTSLKFKGQDTSNASLKCENANDKFTVENNNGNGALTYPIGLLTMQEARLTNYGNYLNNGQKFWFGSPCIFYDFNTYVFTGDASDKVGESAGVRPVISLKPGTEISSGDGSYTSPFEIK